MVHLYIEVNGRWWKLQVGSKEPQQTSHSQRFLIFISSFLLDGIYERSLSSLSPSLALTYSDVS